MGLLDRINRKDFTVSGGDGVTRGAGQTYDETVSLDQSTIDEWNATMRQELVIRALAAGMSYTDLVKRGLA